VVHVEKQLLAGEQFVDAESAGLDGDGHNQQLIFNIII
jgi:hypothetical protein